MPSLSDRLAAGTSRRGFLSRVSGAVLGLTGAGAVGGLVAPGDAEAFHFCGHIYTTDSCAHPTGLPRIDSRGLPLRASDGHPLDDLGRLIGSDGRAIDEDGRPLPRAPRTTVCDAVAEEYDIKTKTDGSWHRCCGGQVRKLVDCCSRHKRRINGDMALTGYCYKGRKVFCVMYYDTKIPC